MTTSFKFFARRLITAGFCHGRSRFPFSGRRRPEVAADAAAAVADSGAVAAPGGAGSSGTVSYPSPGQPGSVSAYVDPQSRQLVVVTDAETARQVQQVVDSLSKPKPQVLIKVVFAEVTYNKGYDVGVEGLGDQAY